MVFRCEIFVFKYFFSYFLQQTCDVYILYVIIDDAIVVLMQCLKSFMFIMLVKCSVSVIV